MTRHVTSRVPSHTLTVWSGIAFIYGVCGVNRAASCFYELLINWNSSPWSRSMDGERLLLYWCLGLSLINVDVIANFSSIPCLQRSKLEQEGWLMYYKTFIVVYNIYTYILIYMFWNQLSIQVLAAELDHSNNILHYYTFININKHTIYLCLYINKFMW